MSGPAKKGESSFLSDIRGSALPGEAPTIARQSRPAWRSFVLVGVFALVGTAGLVGMRVMGRNAGMKLDKFDAEFKPASSAASAAQVTKVLDELAVHTAPLQVPTDAMKRNPFVLEMPKAEVAVAEPDPIVEKPTVDREALERQTLIADTLRGISVTSVVRGAMPLARINDKLYRVGDRIGKVLDIIEISERGVVLSADGKQYVLSMKDETRAEGDEGKAAAKKPKK